MLEKSIFGMEAGIEKETSSSDSFLGFGFYANYLQLSIKQLFKKIRKGVPYESHYKFCREFYETLPIRVEKPLLAG